MSRVIGVTGGIATGKSTVLRMLAELGAEVMSADDLAREALAKGSAGYAEVVHHFGEGILMTDGEINRPALAAIIFSDAEARHILNDITHPRIIAAMRERIDRFRDTPLTQDAVMAVEIPLLVECGLEEIVDEVLFVAAEPQSQVCRLIRRSKVSVGDANKMISAQMPIEHKVKRADRVIWNDGSVDQLESAVHALWREIHLL